MLAKHTRAECPTRANRTTQEQLSKDNEDSTGRAGRQSGGPLFHPHLSPIPTLRPLLPPPHPLSPIQRPSRNTVGRIPLEWYASEGHIGYDMEGRKIAKGTSKSRGAAVAQDKLDAFLSRSDDPNHW